MKEVFGLIVFFAFTVAYIVMAVIVQLKLSRRLKGEGQRFLNEARRDGRAVTAHLDGYVDDYTDGVHSYIADYSYIAPDGKRYKMHGADCIFTTIPSEERTIFLDPRNYRKYVRGNMTLGRHPNLFVAVSLLCWFGIYYLIMRFVIMPIILP